MILVIMDRRKECRRVGVVRFVVDPDGNDWEFKDKDIKEILMCHFK